MAGGAAYPFQADLSWLSDILDAGAPLIAAATALAIAFVAYPWQKNRDRKLQIREEKRASYQRFLQGVTEHQLRLAASLKHREDFGITESTVKAMSLSYELVVYAPPNVIEICETYLSALYELEDSIREMLEGKCEPLDYETTYFPCRRARREAVLAIRKDISGEPIWESKKAVAAFFGDDMKSYAEMQRNALGKLMAGRKET